MATTHVTEIPSLPGRIRQVTDDEVACLADPEKAGSNQRERLAIRFVDLLANDHHAIDAPVALFFGAGTLYNRDHREYLVKAFPSFIRFSDARVELACFFPMPFFKSAKIEIIGPKRKPLPKAMPAAAARSA